MITVQRCPRVIAFVIVAQLLVMSVFAGRVSGSLIVDRNNMLSNALPTEQPAATTAQTLALEHRHMTETILRNVDDNEGNSIAKDSLADAEGDNSPSAELLRFVSDTEQDAAEELYDMSMEAAKSPNNRRLPNDDEHKDKDGDIDSDSASDSDSGSDSDEGNNINYDYLQSLELRDQVRLLSKQLNVLMNRRREDYELLERNLRKSLRITATQGKSAVAGADNASGQPQQPQQSQQSQQQLHANDEDLRNELETLRQEVQDLRKGTLIGNLGVGNSNKERLTIEWLQQAIGELRKQLVELQQLASKAMRDVATRTQSWEDLTTIRSDFQQLKLELAALRERQQQSDVYVQELREEQQQQEEDYRRLAVHARHMQSALKDNGSESDDDHKDSAELPPAATALSAAGQDLLADHRRRHFRLQRQQIHELQLSQRQLKRQFNELKYHRIGERVRSIEIEQHRIADANFNLSRQIASLDKLHSSMLELLEDVENVQTKVDKNLPELRHEISKLEFAHAQLMSEQNLVREEGKNVARSLQAMAVSVSTLQDERDGVRRMQSSVGELRTQMDRLQTIVDDVQRALQHRQHRQPSALSGSQDKKKFSRHHSDMNNDMNTPTTADTPQPNAETLVAKLENVEQQFESIIAKLPKDCSEVNLGETAASDGLHLIAPAADHHPLMAHCTPDGWTTIQRRYDGSADFNRSWEDYARGFGSPAGEFWIGNEQLHHLTLNNCTRLRVLMQDIYDYVWLADYGQFYVSSRSDGYRLHIGGYGGNASDALDYQQGMQFSAIDVDRDISQTHCAANYEGGWWFSHCQHANLNGRYNLGLTWFDAQRNEWIAVKSSQMMIKPHSQEACNYRNDRPEAPSTTATATTTTTTTRTTTTINSNKSIPLGNLRLGTETAYSSSSV